MSRMSRMSRDTMGVDIELGGVYQLPSGHYALLTASSRPCEVQALLVNPKVMRPVPDSAMVLRVSYITRRARLCWKAFDWQRRLDDVAADIASDLARKERIELARSLDISRAKAIDAEYAAIKAANLRLRLAA